MIGGPPRNNEKSLTACKLPRILDIPTNQGRVSGTGAICDALHDLATIGKIDQPRLPPGFDPSQEAEPFPSAAWLKREARYS